MGNNEHWQIQVCPTCRRYRTGGKCEGTLAEPHEPTRCLWVEVVRADLHRGAVEALQQIANGRYDGGDIRRTYSAQDLRQIAGAALARLGGR